MVDLRTCDTKVLLAQGAEGPVRFSPDGKWIAFGSAKIVPSAGGAVHDPFQGTVASDGWSWAWATTSDLLAGITARGGLIAARPDGTTRWLLPDGWGAHTLAFDPHGRLIAVSRYLVASEKYQQIWIIDPTTGARREIYATPHGHLAPPELAGWAPSGEWLLFWSDLESSASLAADGMPLEATSADGTGNAQVIPWMLFYRDFLTWCRSSLIISAGRFRYATENKTLVAAAPPSWRAMRIVGSSSLSWTSPACSPGNRWLAAAAGPNKEERLFGQEQRSLWLLKLHGSGRKRLTDPPAGRSDELPQWSQDGKWILFVRSGPTNKQAGALGAFYLLRVSNAGGSGGLVGPIAAVGPTGNYYGHYGWSADTDWFEPAKLAAGR